MKKIKKRYKKSKQTVFYLQIEYDFEEKKNKIEGKFVIFNMNISFYEINIFIYSKIPIYFIKIGFLRLVVWLIYIMLHQFVLFEIKK